MIPRSCSENCRDENSVLQNRCLNFGTRLPKPERSSTRCFLERASRVSRTSSSPRDMIAPLPNCFSIWLKARGEFDLARKLRPRKVADYKTTVLITGETGTGKDLAAAALHEAPSESSKPARRPVHAACRTMLTQW